MEGLTGNDGIADGHSDGRTHREWWDSRQTFLWKDSQGMVG